MIAVVVIFLGFMGERGEFSGCSSFLFLARGSFACAFGAMLFVGIEDRFQPREDFLERGQAAGRALFTARALVADRTLLALQALLAARTLCARLSICASLARQSCLAGDSRLALRAGFSLRTRFALSACLARCSGCAACAFRAGAAGMTLRAGMSGFALWSLRAGPRYVFCHVQYSMILRYAFFSSVWTTASIPRL